MTEKTATRFLLLLSIPILGELSRPLHGGLGLPIPETPHTIARAALLGAALGGWLWMLRTSPSRCIACDASELRSTSKRRAFRDRPFATTWTLMSIYCTVSVVG